MNKLAAALMLTLAAGCNQARTAYSLDHSKSWMCVVNTKVQEPPLPNGQPMTMLETDQEQKLAAKVLAEQQKVAKQ